MSPADPQLDPDVAQLWELLLAVVLDGEKKLAEHLASHGLTAPQFYVLKTLIEHEGRLGIGQIARLHGLTNATMTGLVSRMEALTPPLVLRETDTVDRRAVVVSLTEAGYARYNAVTNTLLDQLRLVFGLLPAAERRRLLANLEHYVHLILSVVGTQGTVLRAED